MKKILAAVMGATLTFAAVQADAQSSAGQRQVALVIEAKTLDKALDQWAQQSGFQYFLENWDAAKKLAGRQLKGTFSAQEALEQLLDGTPFTYSWLNDRAVRISEKNAVRQSSGNNADQPSRLRLAQLSEEDSAAAASRASRSDSAREVADASPEELEEVVVTGTYLRGVAPVGSPVIVFTRSDIEKTGASTVGEFMRKVPQNFALTDAETNLNNGSSRLPGANSSLGTAINLRGLGPSATLTLLDGQRLAPAGGDGAFVDVSMIPLSAIQRIEMMTDGASAIYGSDAVGGVVNFILRRDFEGAETSLRYGDSTRGGGAAVTAAQLLGASWDGGNAMMVYEYSDQESVDVTQRDFIPPIPTPTARPFMIQPEQRRNSALASVRQRFTDNLAVFGTGFFSERHFERDSYSAVQVIRAEGDVRAVGGSLGATLDFASDWGVTTVADYSSMKQQRHVVPTPGVATNPLDESESVGIDVRLAGSLFDIQGGAVRTNVGVGARRENFDRSATTTGALERDVKSLYGEVFVPLVSPQSGAWTHRLELSLAGRIDDYEDFGSSGVKPKVGVSWAPIRAVALRASWSESFRVPLLSQMDETVTGPFAYSVFSLADPAPPNFTATIFPMFPGNASLEPEESTSLTVGLDITPESLPNFRASLTYYDVDYTNRIALPPLVGSVFLLFQQQAVLAPFIERSPDPAVIAEYYSRGVLNPGGVPAANVRAIFDNRFQNISSTTTSGFELVVSHIFETRAGAFAPVLAANYINRLNARAASTTPEAELFDKIFTPARLKARAGVSWTRAALSTGFTVNYVDKYENTALTPSRPIDSWTTLDCHLQYSGTDTITNPIMRGLSFMLTVQNLTDEDPPEATVPSSVQAFNFGYDGTNASALGRFVSLQVSKRW